MQGTLDVGILLKHYRWRVLLTWVLVLIENTLLALIPLFIGRAIDALLSAQPGALWEPGIVMLVLIVVASIRRAYDTRCYGTIRVDFGAEVAERLADAPVSRVNARLNMSREMVDFLELHVPGLMTAVVQVIVSIVVLWSFDMRLGMSALVLIGLLSVTYALFHRRFYHLNADLNSQTEHQVSILEKRSSSALLSHLRKLRKHEVRISDTEVFLYGSILVGMFVFILLNLWLASTIVAVTAGMIFAILSYSWELVESGFTLPVVLQQWSRLREIRGRLNEANGPSGHDGDGFVGG